MERRKKPLIGVLLFAGVFLYLGWEVVKQESGALVGGDASLEWPTVPGQVETSTVRTDFGTGGDITRYDPVVKYKYSVDGTELDGDRIAFGMQPMSQSNAQTIVKRYPAGQAVTVFYSPDDPANSVLEPGATNTSWLGIAIGIVFVIVAGTMLARKLARSR